jgi:hypothetical protein
MGKEMVCEGYAGTAWVNWATGFPGTSKVYMSIVSDSGPWTTVYDNSSLLYLHEVQVPILAVDSQHWFYVESVSDGAGLEQSAVFTFCTAGTVIISISGSLTMTPSLSKPIVVSLVDTGVFSGAAYAGEGTPGPQPPGPGGAAAVSAFALDHEITEIADSIGAGYASHSVV